MIRIYVFNCVLLYVAAAPVSLNKLIEAEALPSDISPTISKPDFITKPISLNKLIEAEENSRQTHRQKLVLPKAIQEKSAKRTGLLNSGLSRISKSVSGTVFSNRNLSPLHYRKSFEIKSPVKPKRVTLFQRNRLRGQSDRRDTYQYGRINQNYVPLLRNLGVLFDNILTADPSEHGQDYFNESEERVCTCVTRKRNPGRETGEKAAASSRVSVTETPAPPQDPTTTATPTTDNLSSVGRDKNVSLLFTRNTTGVWRNNPRVREGSGAPHLRSAERHIPRACGDDGCDSGDRETETDTEDDEEDTDGDFGDDAGNDRPAVGGTSRNTFVGTSVVSHKFKIAGNETTEGARGLAPEYEGEIQFEIRTDKAKGARVLPELNSGLRDTEELLQTTQVEEGVNEYGDASHQQFPVRNGQDPEEDQKLRGAYEGVTVKSNNDKYVMIYDGYSVARDVNGKNTLTEKAITIHS